MILLFKFFNLFFGFSNQFFLGIRNNQVIFTERNTGFTCVLEAKSHQAVNKHNGFFLSAVTINDIDDFTDFFLFNQAVNQSKRNILVLRRNFGNHQTAGCCINNTAFALTVFIDILHTAFDFAVQINNFCVKSQQNFVVISKNRTFAFQTFGIISQVVNTQYHILCRNDNRFTRSRRQNVVG